MEITINYLAVFVAALVGMIIGMAWYSPSLFGNEWMKLIGLSEKEMEKSKKKGMGKLIAIAFASQLVMAYVLAHFAAIASVERASGALQLGFWIWLGFVATIALGAQLWEGRKPKLWFINAGHWLVVILAMSIIVGLWK